MLHEHAASLSAASHANRSRRLNECAKESGHYPLRMSLVSGRSALICLTERGENRWNSNERDDSVVSWINDRDRVICGVDRVEQTGQLRYFARKIVGDALHS
jgi:hypothetical protein